MCTQTNVSWTDATGRYAHELGLWCHCVWNGRRLWSIGNGSACRISWARLFILSCCMFMPCAITSCYILRVILSCCASYGTFCVLSGPLLVLSRRIVQATDREPNKHAEQRRLLRLGSRACWTFACERDSSYFATPARGAG